MKILLDTNILLDYPQIVKDEDDIVISTSVLKELDGLKQSLNSDTSFKARRAAVVLSHNLDRIEWNTELEQSPIPVDEKLLQICRRNGFKLITNDVYLKVKAIIEGIETEGYRLKDDYTGIRTVFIETDENRYNEWLDYVLQNRVFPDGTQCYENEYFIIKDANHFEETRQGEKQNEVLAILCWRNGELVQVRKNPVIKNTWIDEIVPKNYEQACLFDALKQPQISVLYAGGQFGTG